MTRDFVCKDCDVLVTRTELGLREPDDSCPECGRQMKVKPSFPAGLKFKGSGFHSVDYPKSSEQKIKDFGLEQHDSTNPAADFHQDGYAEEMASNAPSQKKSKRQQEVEEFAKSRGK